LLIAEESTVVASIESQVTHKATRAIVHEDSLLLVIRTTTLNHVEDDILQAGGLSDLPMNASASRHGKTSEVDDKIADLAVEVVLVGVPVDTTSSIRVRVDDSNTLEVGAWLEDRKASC
jgi:hypothetical protein